MVITIGAIKGGTGKTTLAINLAVFLGMQGKNVALVDADPQASATMFSKMRNKETGGNLGYHLYPFTEDFLFDQLNFISMNHDFVIIDTGGRDTRSLRTSIVKSNVFLAPFKPRCLDVWTAPQINQIMEEIQQVRLFSPIKAYTFLNMADQSGTDNEEAQELMAAMTQLKFIENRVGNRKVFSKATGAGKGVLEMKEKDISTLKAQKELQDLFLTILKPDDDEQYEN